MKSYKNKKMVYNPREDWLIFENTHEPIVTQQEFDLVQELRKNKRRPTQYAEGNPFSGVCYCADCGGKLHLGGAGALSSDGKHLKCGTYAKDKGTCSAHFIRTAVLQEIVLGELNKMVSFVKENEDEQKKLRETVAELTAYIETAEQKSADVTAFIMAVQKYEYITELTPEIMHELIEKIVIHAPDKSSGHRIQEIGIHYRFNVVVATAVADSLKYDKKRKAA